MCIRDSGETEEDVAELERFLVAARLDVVGVFGYSDEDGTEGELLTDKVDPEVIAERVERVRSLVEELSAQRAEERVGEVVEVLVEEIDDETGEISGRAAHQGPDVDGVTLLTGAVEELEVGTIVTAEVIGTEGIDLVGRVSA